MSTPAKAKMPQNVSRCQFLLSDLYAIKFVVVAHSLLAYNIVFFKIVFNIFPRSYFQKHLSQT